MVGQEVNGTVAIVVDFPFEHVCHLILYLLFRLLKQNFSASIVSVNGSILSL